MNYSDETADEMAKLQDEIDAENLWDLDSQVELAMDALRCPPGDADVDQALGRRARRVALCQLLLDQPDLLLLDEPTNHLDAEIGAWLEGHLRNYPGADPDRHPRPLLPRQRRRLDPRARPRPRHSLRGQLLGLAGAEAEAARAGRPRGRGAPAARSSASANGSRRRPRRARPSPRRAIQRYEELLEAGEREADRRPRRSSFRVAERLGQNVIDVEGLTQGLRRQAADRRPDLQAAAGRHRRRHRPERRRQDHAVPHDHRPGEAGRRHDHASARPCSSATSTRSATRSTATRPCGRRSPAATTSSCSASAR